MVTALYVSVVINLGHNLTSGIAVYKVCPVLKLLICISNCLPESSFFCSHRRSPIIYYPGLFLRVCFYRQVYPRSFRAFLHLGDEH